MTIQLLTVEDTRDGKPWVWAYKSARGLYKFYVATETLTFKPRYAGPTGVETFPGIPNVKRAENLVQKMEALPTGTAS